jgi:nucleoside-triphosphatase THEP1
VTPQAEIDLPQSDLRKGLTKVVDHSAAFQWTLRMFRLSRASGSPAILAIVYADGVAAGSFIADLGYRLRDAGVAIAGIVPYRSSTPRTGRCGVEVEELASRLVLQLSEDENPQPFGCRVDPEAISEAAALISSSLRKAPNVVIFNKFGKMEAEGGGLRETIAEAIQLGIPVIAGVPRRNVGIFRELTEGLAEETQVDSPRIYQWLAARKMVVDCERPAIHGQSDVIRAAS